MRFNIAYYGYVDMDNLQNKPSPNESWDDYPCGYLEYDDEEEEIWTKNLYKQFPGFGGTQKSILYIQGLGPHQEM